VSRSLISAQLVFHRGGQVRLGERLARGRERVDAVGLPIRATAAARPAIRLGGTRTTRSPRATRNRSKPAGHAAHVLKRPHALARKRTRQAQLLVPGRAEAVSSSTISPAYGGMCACASQLR
jgi:hypothetical protein